MSVVPVTRGHHYVVSAGHELAALAAFEALENGGNAIDAGVAAILTLGVVYSDQVSVAGVAPMIVRLAETGEVVTIAGVGGWPKALDAEAFIERHGGTIPLGVRRTVVPRGACRLHPGAGALGHDDLPRRGGGARCAMPVKAFPGTRSCSTTCAVTPTTSATGRRTSRSGCPAGKCRRPASGWARPIWAGPCSSSATRSARPAAIAWPASPRCATRSTGATSQARSSRTSGRTTGCSRRTTLTPSAVRSCPPSPGGFGSTARRSRSTPAAPGARARSCWKRSPSPRRRASAGKGTARTRTSTPSRRRSSSRSPTGKPISATPISWTCPSIRSSATPTRPSGARPSTPAGRPPGLPLPGRVPGHEAYVPPGRRMPGAAQAPARYVHRLRHRRGRELALLDAVGHELGYAGGARHRARRVLARGAVVGGAGASLLPRAGQAPPAHAQSLPRPSRPAAGSCPSAPPAATRRSRRNLQTLLGHLAFGLGLQDAVEAPRLVTHSHPDSFAPHAARPGLVTLEGRIDDATGDALAARGHRVERLGDWSHWTGGVCAVRKDVRTGEIEGAADPRRMSRALGW